MKNVDAVPSGPTKLNGPESESLAAAWKRSVVFAGVVPFQLSVVQFVVMPRPGLLSRRAETRVPGTAT